MHGCAGSSPGRPARHGRDHRAVRHLPGVKISAIGPTGCRRRTAATKPQRRKAWSATPQHGVGVVEPQGLRHDEVATDKRKSHGQCLRVALWGDREQHDFVPVSTRSRASPHGQASGRDPKDPSAANNVIMAPRSTGAKRRFGRPRPSRTRLMLDEKARVWYAARGPSGRHPISARPGSDHPSAKMYPINTSNRHVTCLTRRPRI